MSYTDGIGNLQQALASIASAEAKPAQKVADADAGAKQNVANGAAPADQAHLSTTGGLISRALENSDVRMEKVQALQQAIASGSYHVSSSDVADKLIKTLME